MFSSYNEAEAGLVYGPAMENNAYSGRLGPAADQRRRRDFSNYNNTQQL